MEEIGRKDPSIKVPLTVIQELIAEADHLYKKEDSILEANTFGDKAEDLAEDDMKEKQMTVIEMIQIYRMSHFMHSLWLQQRSHLMHKLS